MEIGTQSISVRGRSVEVPCLRANGVTFITSGKTLRIASIFDEEWVLESDISNPLALIEIFKEGSLKADIFTFTQRVPEAAPYYDFPMEWDNSAIVDTSDFKTWWEALPQEARKNVRRGEKRGVTARVVPFDDGLVQGIKAIYDEAPSRQGRPFWHYGKSLDEVKRANATYLERSDFVAAYLGEELIGFIKMVYVGNVARIMQIISKNAHADKRPPNILLTKAIEVCAQKGIKYFIYGQYYYGNKGHTPITEFKKRNGFVMMETPRYYIPLTFRGRIALALNLHKGAKNFIPKSVSAFLLDARAKYHARRAKVQPAPLSPVSTNE